MGSTQFQAFLAEEISKVKGLSYPVKAGFLRRVLIRKAPCSKLHPNPADEFCFPEIGPNYGIMSRYATDFRNSGSGRDSVYLRDSSAYEPLEVEKIHPDGYMILNGHHRWGAAHQAGISRMRIHIIDLTQESDIRKMLEASVSDRRVTLDLDEVVFRPEGDSCLEKPLRFPLNRIYRERLRLGIPALFHYLNGHGYDVWIYTAKYYSVDYLRYYLKHYHSRVTGIVTGAARNSLSGASLQKLLDARYKSTVHIDNETVLRTFTGSRSYDEFPLSGAAENWSRDVIDVFEKMRKNG